MVTLNPPVIFTPSPIARGAEAALQFGPVEFSTLEITLLDNASRRTCVAHIRDCPRGLVLWAGDDYDAVGDYTQEEAEARVTHLLGDQPAVVLAHLFSANP